MKKLSLLCNSILECSLSYHIGIVAIKPDFVFNVTSKDIHQSVYMLYFISDFVIHCLEGIKDKLLYAKVAE